MATMKTLNGYGFNATELNGIAASGYLQKTDTAADSSKLGGESPEHYATTQSVSRLKDEKVDKSSVINNFMTTQEGFVADARALKDLNDRMGTPLHAVPSIMLSKKDNWDNVNPGAYYFNTWAHDGGANYPKGGMGIVMFIKAYDGTYGAQYCISDSWLGVRILSTSKWGSWKYLALS